MVLFTVAAGTASLYFFNGFNTGIMNQYRENTIHARYGYAQVYNKGYYENVYEKPWEEWIEKPETTLSQLQSLPQIKEVFPRIDFFALLTNGDISISGRGQGVVGSDEVKFFTHLNIEEGKDLSTESDGVVLGKGLAKALNVKVGDQITALANTVYGSLNASDLSVVGIFHTGSKGFDDTFFRLQLKETQELLETTKVETIALGFHGANDFAAVKQSLLKKDSSLEIIPFEVLDKVYYQNAVDWLNSQFGVIQFIILFVVLLGIFNTVSSGVFERKQEIGNLRANGESKMDILKLFTLEGLLLGMLAAAIGIIVATLINMTILSKGILMPPSPGLTRQFYVKIELQVLMALKTFLMGSLCCALGTVLAARKVNKMSIADMLRSS